MSPYISIVKVANGYDIGNGAQRIAEIRMRPDGRFMMHSVTVRELDADLFVSWDTAAEVLCHILNKVLQ